MRTTTSKTKAPAASEASRHTLGPWRVNSNAGFGDIILGPDYIVARADREFTGKDEESANARLIAAAPELLEACKMALTQIMGSDIQGVWLNAPNKPEITPESVLRAAIAKAEGK